MRVNFLRHGLVVLAVLEAHRARAERPERRARPGEAAGEGEHGCAFSPTQARFTSWKDRQHELNHEILRGSRRRSRSPIVCLASRYALKWAAQFRASAAIEQRTCNSAGSEVREPVIREYTVITNSPNQRKPPSTIHLVRVGALSFRSLVEALDDPCQSAHINLRLQFAIALGEHRECNQCCHRGLRT